jgi:CxxC motif-containing protein
MTDETFQYVCVHCPKGCVISVRIPEGVARTDLDALELSGHECKHGIEYAKQELVEPMRVLTTTVRVRDSDRMLPVRSSGPLPRERLMEAVRLLDGVEVIPTVSVGQVVYKKIMDFDIDILATLTLS